MQDFINLKDFIDLIYSKDLKNFNNYLDKVKNYNKKDIIKCQKIIKDLEKDNGILFIDYLFINSILIDILKDI